MICLFRTAIIMVLCFCAIDVIAHNSAKVLSSQQKPAHEIKTGSAADSVYLFSYVAKSESRNGLHFAWSRDREKWTVIGHDYSFLQCDYGRWGSEKRMQSPFLFHAKDGLWHCIWSLNERDNVFAHAASANLLDWGRQSYPVLKAGQNCLSPVLNYDAAAKRYLITYRDNGGRFYQTSTANFKTYSPAHQVAAALYTYPGQTISTADLKATGQVQRVPWSLVNGLITANKTKEYKDSINNDRSQPDITRFAGLKPIKATVTLQPLKAKPISDLLIGVFFEDLNYAADGGLYAELIQNRDFEYKLSDKEYGDKTWTSTHSWLLEGQDASFTIDSVAPVNPNNPHYAVLAAGSPGAALTNTGFDGIVVKKDETYNLSLFSKLLKGAKLLLQVSIVDDKANLLAETTIKTATGNWQKSTAALIPNAGSDHAMLRIKALNAGTVALDMISLFPQQTYKGHPNGLRADLAETIAAIHPRFMRFPGGCVAHGDGLGNIYRWKNTIGPLEGRVPQRNLWGYHQSAGLGYFEYFQFCEDIGAAPVPIIAAGVPCQNSATGGAGQQGGIPMEQMNAYIQDIIDLVEWANGPATSTWGKKRAEAGHPKPFNLKYIGIGNEDLISDVFEERYTMIYKALKKAHPEITVIGTVGPESEGTDYREGWNIAGKLKIPVVDEHYYKPPGWFLNNQNFYDNYDRSKSKVYLGEYATFMPGRASNLEAALTEALYMASLERNGDIVKMASYAPLLAKDGHTQWNPDLIHFNNTEVKPTVNYYVQQLYGQNSGDQYVPATISLQAAGNDVSRRIAVSVVRDTKSNDIIIKMINLLPVNVSTGINLSAMNISNATGKKILLQGDPDAKNVRPEESVIHLTGKTNIDLPAYSFTVIRVPAK